MISFLEDSFPLAIAFGATGGPERKTDIVPLATGFEARNARWSDSRRRYDAGSGIRSVDDLRQVVSLFEKARGRLVGFRFRDPFDHCSASSGTAISNADQVIATGDGVRTRFRLTKTYGGGGQAYVREIRLPQANGLTVAVDGVSQQTGSRVSIDPQTGELVFGEAPPDGAQITAGFRFDLPVRFDTDHLEISITHFRAGDIPSIPLVEIRLD